MSDPWQIVRDFESAVAEFTGARYGVAVDTATWGLFLCCRYFNVQDVYVPNRTYVSVPQYVRHAGGRILWTHREWVGEYRLNPYPIIDSACRFKAWMHIPGTYRCVSFNTRKHLAIGRGGMILHDDPEADRWFRLARNCGREESPNALPITEGWHCFMEPFRAAEGLHRLSLMPDKTPDDLRFVYPDLSQSKAFQ